MPAGNSDSIFDLIRTNSTLIFFLLGAATAVPLILLAMDYYPLENKKKTQ